MRERFMKNYEPTCVLDIRAELGEHPIWSAEGNCLYWLDIEKTTLNRFVPSNGRNRSWKLPSRPGCFALLAAGDLIVAAQDGIYEMKLATGAIERLMAPAHDPVIMRFNDGRTDAQGRFWVSAVRADMDLTDTSENSYFRLDERGLTKMLNPVGCPNGTAFSPDGKTMYRARSET